jgi:[ribosomal protein S18]-alanine N-acetyltransferase
VCAETTEGKIAAEVRPGRVEDLPAIQAILQDAPEAAAWNPKSLEEVFEQNVKYFFIAEKDGAVLGFIAGRRLLDEAEVLNLAVLPAVRKKGLGRALLQVLVETFSREGTLQVFLEVRESNRPAISFYQHAGFGEIGKRHGYYRNPEETALVLAVRLNADMTGSTA